MNEYTVIFEQNQPVSASRVDSESRQQIKISRQGNRSFIDWMVVYGDSEDEAIEIAGKVTNTIWAHYLA